MKDKDLKELIWDIFNYSTFYIVAIDKEMKILLANYALAKLLGFDSENNLAGKSWFDFIPEDQRCIIENVSRHVCDGNTPYQEYSSQVLSKDGKYSEIRWFGSFLNNSFKCVFNIGIPLEHSSPEDGIDSIRAFYRDVLEKDSKMIQTMKESIGIHIPKMV